MGLCILLVIQTGLWLLPHCTRGKEVTLAPPAALLPESRISLLSWSFCTRGIWTQPADSCAKSLADPLDFYTWFWEGLNESVHKAGLIPKTFLVVCGG